MGESKGKVSFTEHFLIRLVGENLTIFNPTNIVAGDGLKIIYLQRSGASSKSAATSVLLSRVLLIVSALVLVLGSLLYLLIAYSFQLPTYVYMMILSLGVIVITGLLYLILDSRLLLYKLVLVLKSSFSGRWLSAKHTEYMHDINAAMVSYYLTSKIQLLGGLFYSAIHWIFGALEFFVILSLLGIEISLFESITVEMGVLGFKTAGSVIPGQIGIEEYGNKVMLGVIGISIAEIWIVVSLLRRARQIFWLIVSAVTSLILHHRYKIQTVD